jgi:hypothetical protein
MMAPPNALPTWEESEREVEASLKPKEVDPEGDPEEQVGPHPKILLCARELCVENCENNGWQIFRFADFPISSQAILP